MTLADADTPGLTGPTDSSIHRATIDADMVSVYRKLTIREAKANAPSRPAKWLTILNIDLDTPSHGSRQSQRGQAPVCVLNPRAAWLL